MFLYWVKSRTSKALHGMGQLSRGKNQGWRQEFHDTGAKFPDGGGTDCGGLQANI